ncbi:MAG: FAD-binding protein [Fimbriimonadaceae bacterium]|nr:FAD-binding protein [Fimbriimonadaceae bacterium]
MTDAEQIARGMESILEAHKVLSGPGALRAYDCDAYTVDRSKPAVVVLPESTDEVQKVVQWCVANSVPYTARGAGTGLSGGALAAMGGVIISTKKLTKILEIDVENRCLLAQAGIANKRISDAVAEHGLHFAPDPSSQTVSTLGGNIAENSGGPHTLKYGVTVQHILGITMVEPNGEVVRFGGEVPGGPGYDFLGLIVGSEGTLGIVTEAWVKLTPVPAAVKTALAAFPTVRGATQAVAQIIAEGVLPAAMEIMDKGILKALKAAFNLQYPEGAEALLLVECDSSDQLSAISDRGVDIGDRRSGIGHRETPSPNPLPLAPSSQGEGSFGGDQLSAISDRGVDIGDQLSAIGDPIQNPKSKIQNSEDVVQNEMSAVSRICQENGALEVRIAKDERERQELWTARKKGIGAMGRLAPSIVTHDGVIPRSKLPEMLDFVYKVAEEHGLGVANLFHAGDGNLHPCFYFDDRDPDQVKRVVEAGEVIVRRCIELGGSVTGEHGIGVEKVDLMPLMFSPADLELQAMAKRIFNDGMLCNPCKILPNQKSCVEHQKRWRGVAW